MDKIQSTDSTDLCSDLTYLTAEKQRIYLSDVIDESAFKRGQANIIVAPCHSGKTTAAFTKISSLASCPEKVLMLIDTTAGKEALLKREETNRYSTKWQREIRWLGDKEKWGSLLSGDGIRVMTYHQLGYQLEAFPDLLETVDVVICDEMHNLLTYRNIERANNEKWKQKGSSAEIKVCERAWTALAKAANKEDSALIVIMTATVNTLSAALDRKRVKVEYFDFSDQVTRDTAKNTIYYNDIKAVLEKLKPTERAIIYTQRVSMMHDIEKMADNGRRNICSLWSLNNMDYEMTEKQLRVRETILSKKRIPPEVDILLLNAAYETSINIENEDFQTMIIHSGSAVARTQARGRLRHDIENLYLYDPNHEHIAHYFPEEYFGRFLTSADTATIVESMNIRDEEKWRPRLHIAKSSVIGQNRGCSIIRMPLKMSS